MVVAETASERHRLVRVLQHGGLRVVPGNSGDSGDALVLRLARMDAERVRSLRATTPSRPIVVAADSATPRAVREAVAAGADGVVLEGRIEEHLALAVRSACSGQLTIPGELRETFGRPVLSNREKQILGMVVMGCANREIASRLYVAESTVKSHLSSAFQKLGVRSRTEATALILDASGGFGTGILAILEGSPSAHPDSVTLPDRAEAG